MLTGESQKRIRLRMRRGKQGTRLDGNQTGLSVSNKEDDATDVKVNHIWTIEQNRRFKS